MGPLELAMLLVVTLDVLDPWQVWAWKRLHLNYEDFSWEQRVQQARLQYTGGFGQYVDQFAANLPGSFSVSAAVSGGKQISGAAILLVGAWQLLTVVHDVFGLQVEAVIYVALSVVVAVKVTALEAGMYEYSPLPVEADAAPGILDVNRQRRLALASLFGSVVVANVSEVTPWLRGHSAAILQC
eukprot:Skav222193  [mRNA]  locus=scaffold1745:40765:44200:- [translate_table: standard]